MRQIQRSKAGIAEVVGAMLLIIITVRCNRVFCLLSKLHAKSSSKPAELHQLCEK